MTNTMKLGLAMVFMTACAGQPETMRGTRAVPPGEPTTESAAQFGFLPPLAGAASMHEAGVADASPEVRLCDWTGAACAPLLAVWTTTWGPEGQGVTMDPRTGVYAVDWRPEQFRLESDHVYRISVLVGGIELSHADVGLNDAGQLIDLNTRASLTSGDRGTVPIRFRLSPASADREALERQAESR